VPRVLAADGSARPAWLAMRLAAKQGLKVVATAHEPTTGFGLRITMHSTRAGPRSAAAASERLVDGVIPAFHSRDIRPRVASLVADRVAAKAPWMSRDEVELLLGTDGPGPLFPWTPLTLTGWFNPADDRCHAGAVVIRDDAKGSVPEISGELFSLRRLPRLPE
jgi:hypothetical protein